jgi:peptide/nickel transport system substrate-binding protein
VDVAPQVFSPLLLPPLEAQFPAARTMGANLTYLVPRVDRGALADVHVRRALALAIDRERLARTYFDGHALAATTLLPPQLWAHSAPPAGSPFRFDIDAARSELLAAGIDAAHPTKFTLLVSTDRFRGALARFVAQELLPLGVHVEIVTLELGVLLDRLSRGAFDLALLQMPELTEPNTLQVFLHSRFMPPNGSNRGHVQNLELDRLLDLGDQTNDTDARKLIYEAVEREAATSVPLIPLFHEEQVVLLGPRGKGFVPSPEGRLNGLSKL